MSDAEPPSAVPLQQIYELDDVHELLDYSERYLESLVDDCEEKRAAYAHNVAQVWHHIADYEEAHPQFSLHIHEWRQRIRSRLGIDQQLSHADWLQGRNMNNQEQIELAWGAPIDEVLGELRPDKGFSKHVIEMVARLSKRLTRKDACRRLSDQVERRAKIPWAQGPQGMRRDRHLFPCDIRATEAAIMEEQELAPKVQEDTKTSPPQPEEKENGNVDADQELAHVTMRKKRRLMKDEDRLFQAPQCRGKEKAEISTGGNGPGEPDQSEITPTSRSNSSGGSDRSIEIGRSHPCKLLDEYDSPMSAAFGFGLDNTRSSPTRASSPRLQEESLLPELDEDTRDLLTRSTAATLSRKRRLFSPQPVHELLEQHDLKKPLRQTTTFGNHMLATPVDARTPSSPVSAPGDTENTKTDGEMLPCTDVKGALDTLRPTRMLSGTVIDLILRLLSCGLEPNKRLYTNPVLEPGPKLKPLHPEARTVFVPVHHTNPDHWTLAEFDIPQRVVFHYDSLGPSDTESSATMLLKLQHFLTRVSDLSVEGWSFRYASGPIQTNAVDCGVHVLVTLLYRLCDLTPDNNNVDCIFWRQILISLLSKVPQPAAPDNPASISSSKTSGSTSMTSALPTAYDSIAQHWDTSLSAMTALHQSFQKTQSDICASQARLERIETAQAMLDRLHGNIKASISSQADPGPASIERDLHNLDQQIGGTQSLATIPDCDRDDLLSRLQIVRANTLRQLQQSRSRLIAFDDHMSSLDAAKQTASTISEALQAETKESKCKIGHMVQPLQSLTGTLSGVAWRIGSEYALEGG